MTLSFGLIGALRLVAICAVVVTTLAAIPGRAFAQTAQGFVGNWLEDQSKRTIGSLRSLTFRQTANGGLEELRGSYARPLVQPVRFDGKPYQVDGSRNTLVWKQLDATHYERAISQDDQLINTRRIQISADGSTLTEATESLDGGKKVVTTIVYRRTSGSGTALAGVWKPQSQKSDVPNTLRIEAAGNGLRVVTNERSNGRTSWALTADGKPSPVEGAAVISGTATAGKVVNNQSIEWSQSREGVATGRTTWTLSEGGKVLTASTTNVGPDSTGQPSITVYVRQ
jgi:hypothetical protein